MYQVDETDRYLYCGTTSGDVLKVRLSQQEDQVPALVACLARTPEKKSRRTREGEAYTGGTCDATLRYVMSCGVYIMRRLRHVTPT